MTTTILEVKNLTKYIKKKLILNNLNFTVTKGTIFGMLGHNGAGKTTLIKTLVGCLNFCHGEIIFHHDSNSKIIGYLPENFNFSSKIKLQTFLEILTNFNHKSKVENKQAIRDILKILNLEDKVNEKIYKFSSGVQKKVMLAQCLLLDSDLLILDEPTANLDPTSRNQFMNFLLKLKAQGKTIIVATHILKEFEDFFDGCIILSEGKIKKSITRKEDEQWNLQQIYDQNS